MSVRRFGNVNIYIDGDNVAVFPENQLGSLASGNYYFGAKRSTYPETFSQYFAGYFDEIRIWNSALSKDVILLNQNSKLRGDEAGLQAYYPFEKYIKQSNGLITVTQTAENIAETDNNNAGGSASGFTDVSLPVKDVRPIENVPFNYVSSSNKIVFTLDPNFFSRVEGTVLNITVKDVRDLRNNKSATESWTAFVRRNALLWEADPVNIIMEEGDTYSFTARITNTGGTSVSYSIENLPTWLNVNSSIGNLAPLANKDLIFTVVQGVNVGYYETGIGLTSGNGVVEILPVQLKVMTQRPDWHVNPNDFESSMNITGQIKIEGVFQEDMEDLLAAFIGDLCVGVTSPIFVDVNNAYFTFLNIYGNSQHNNKPLTFKLWDASTGRIYPKIETLTMNGNQATVENILFAPSQVVGSINKPMIFNALDVSEQLIQLKHGWNWISVNVLNSNPTIFNQMKTSLSVAGELIKGRNAFVQQPKWTGTLNNISETSMYSVLSNRDFNMVLTGQYANPASTPITIVNGWNWIGYIPAFNLPVQSALAGINAQPGDHIKGQTDYAVYTGTNWVGTLTFMQSGKGYMYQSNNSQSQTFVYPTTALRGGIQYSSDTRAELKWNVDVNKFSNNMVMTAIVVQDGIELANDLIEIGAFCGDECRGAIMLQHDENSNRYLGFLMIHGEGNELITLKVHDHNNNQTYNANNASLQFAADNIYGTPQNPYMIGLGSTVEIQTIIVPFEELVVMRWNNSLTVKNNPENNGGYNFVSYKWYRNDSPAGVDQSWSAGANGEQINQNDRFYVEALADNNILVRTTEYSLTLKGGSVNAYPNPVSIGQTLLINIGKSATEETTIEICDMLGRTVVREKSTELNGIQPFIEIPVDGKFSAGMYILIVKDKNSKKEIKLTVYEK